MSLAARVAIAGLLLLGMSHAAEGFTADDYAQHIKRLKEKIPAGGQFTIVIEPPFVVVGDESPDAVRQHAQSTVRWAVQRLKRDYFAKDPQEILDIWLFKDDQSYRKYAREIFNEEPSTPYGYYSAAEKALVMNIATGGGTLVHEIVHPFMRSNFPQCPPWFNEGLGSLYEQSTDRDGHIQGLTNWRLAGLQKAIKAGKVPSFKALMAMDLDEFYNQDKGTNYGQARYLCYYLQEKGLLTKFYHEFQANCLTDPTGFNTLKKVLGESDMEAFKRTWEEFVMELNYGSD